MASGKVSATTMGDHVVSTTTASAFRSSNCMMPTSTTHPHLSTWPTPPSLNTTKLMEIGEPVTVLYPAETKLDNLLRKSSHSGDAVQLIPNRQDHHRCAALNPDKHSIAMKKPSADCPIQVRPKTFSSGKMTSHQYRTVRTPVYGSASGCAIPSTISTSHCINQMAGDHNGRSEKETKQCASYSEVVGCMKKRPWSTGRSMATCPDNVSKHRGEVVESQASSTSIQCIPNPRIILPVLLAGQEDAAYVTPHQAFLRQQIEVFAASSDDMRGSVRGRHKAIQLGQVGVRCRHCAHVPPVNRAKGSTYYPISIQGFYQAAQNMCSTHLQCGLCTHMADSIKDEFSAVLAAKKSKSSGSGRVYWTRCAQEMDLVDTDHGVYYRTSVPAGVSIVDLDPNMYRSKSSKKKRKMDS